LPSSSGARRPSRRRPRRGRPLLHRAGRRPVPGSAGGLPRRGGARDGARPRRDSAADRRRAVIRDAAAALLAAVRVLRRRLLLAAIAPLLVVAVFFWLTRERPLSPWVPWWGVLLGAVVALPWYMAMEAKSAGFLGYTLFDSNLYGLTRQRALPDENVPLGSLEFVVVTLLALLPWSLALPSAFARAFQRRWESTVARLWLVLGLWSAAVLGFFVLVPYRLPHSALPAFPALALLVARVWAERVEGAPGAPSVRALLVPALALV